MIAFTLCSNNYLPKARIWCESLRRHNPEVYIVVGLIDRLDRTIDYNEVGASEVLPVDQVGIPNFEEMVLRYDLVDLNTAAKPSYFRYLFRRHSEEKDLKICYFDPDIGVYASLGSIEDSLDRAAVLLTPHALSPIPLDGKHPSEEAFLTFGLYNLGFCALRRSDVAERVLDWWTGHLIEGCRFDPAKGIFVDQAWMDLVPLFFEHVEVSRHAGLNVAYWNLHERAVVFQDGNWQVNSRWPLVFFHFSDFALTGSAISRTQSRFTLDDRPQMRPLFEEYRSKLSEYGFDRFRSIPCVYVVQRAEALVRERRDYHRKHPGRWLIATAKQMMPKPLKELLRSC